MCVRLVRKSKLEEFQKCTDLGEDTAVAQRPRFTRVLTHRTHDGGVGFTDLSAEERSSRSHQRPAPAPGQRGTFPQTDLTWLESIVKRP